MIVSSSNDNDHDDQRSNSKNVVWSRSKESIVVIAKLMVWSTFTAWRLLNSVWIECSFWLFFNPLPYNQA